MILPFLSMLSMMGAARGRAAAPTRRAALPGDPSPKRRKRSKRKRRKPRKASPGGLKALMRKARKRRAPDVERGQAAARSMLSRLALVTSPPVPDDPDAVMDFTTPKDRADAARQDAAAKKRRRRTPRERLAAERAKRRGKKPKTRAEARAVLARFLGRGKKAIGPTKAEARKARRQAARRKIFARRKRGARALYRYVTETETRPRRWGNRNRPNDKIAAVQRAMGKLEDDGIYGPNTRARGRKLIKKTFPARR